MTSHIDKFAPPGLPANSIPRSGLLKMLEQSQRSRLVIIQGPAGYGKTTLMCQYYHALKQRGKVTAWISLSKSDDDVVAFLKLLMESSNHAKVDAQATGSDTPEKVVPEAVEKWMIHAFGSQDIPAYIFFDEFEHISDATILETVAAFNDLPNPHQIIIGSRKLPEFSYSHLQLNDDVTLIDSTALRFDQEECTRFFQESMPRGVADSLVEQILEQTEGWPAALQLSSLLLSQLDKLEGTIDHLIEKQLFSDQVVENILSNLSEDVRTFLLKTCILDDLDSAICEHVSGMENAGHLLQTLYRNGLFTLRRVTTDHYHYHALFSSTLRRLQRKASPGEAIQLHRKACDWFLTHNKSYLAAEHALMANDFDLAATIIEENVLDLAYNSQLEPVLHWSAILPKVITASLPNLQLACAWAHVMTRNRDGAREALDTLQPLVESGVAGTDMAFLGLPIAAISSLLADNLDDLEQSIEKSLPTLPANAEFERHALNNVLTYVDLTTNQFESSRSLALGMQSSIPLTQSRYSVIFSYTLLAMGQVIQGELRQAHLTLDAVNVQSESYEPHAVAWAAPIPVLAELLYEENKIEKAQALLVRAMPFIRNLAVTDLLISAYSTLSRIHAMENRHHLAFKVLEDLERIGYSDNLPRLIATARCEIARLHQLLGNIARAENIYYSIMGEGLSPRLPRHTFHPGDIEAEDITVIRLRLGQGELLAARERLEQALEETHPQRAYRQLKLQIMSSLIHWANSESKLACDTLLQAIRSCRQEPFVRIFIDEGRPMLNLLHETHRYLGILTPQEDTAEALAYIDNLLSQAGDQLLPQLSQPVEQELVEPLTPRELEMLQMITDGHSNKDIANKRQITESTVKWHLSNIYSKMGVKNRTQAIANGRQLGLIS